MTRRIVLDPDLIRRHVHYDPNTGQLVNLIETPRMPVGHIFTTRYPDTYIKVHIAGRAYAAHRVAWVWMTGEQPDDIDHINRTKHDNRWSNLRSVSHSENMRNRRYVRRCS